MKKPVKKFGGGIIKAALSTPEVKQALASSGVPREANPGVIKNPRSGLSLFSFIKGSRTQQLSPLEYKALLEKIMGGKALSMKTGGEVKNKKPVWEESRPKGLGKPKKLSAKAKSSAKAMAKKAGRPYPNLVDNMRAARKKK